MVTFGHSHGENLGDGPGDTIGAAGVWVGGNAIKVGLIKIRLQPFGWMAEVRLLPSCDADVCI